MKTNSTINRRDFTKKSIAFTTATMAASSYKAVYGANEQVQLGFIGLGGRGSHHLRQFQQFDNVKITSLCDAYLPNVEQNAERIEHDVQKTQDFRQVLDNADVDAVIIASPDHWHALQTIYACQAGKDVYVEKPMTRTIEEGKRVIEATHATKRVVQVGQQQRSSKQFIQAVEMVKNGEIGKVSSARCINMWPIFGYLSQNLDEFHQEDATIPEGLDYDMWLGPAPYVPFTPSRFKTNFYFYLDYSGCMITGWGVHVLDIVTWAMGPTFHGACTYGGKYVFDDMRDTPDTVEIIYDTPGYTLSYSMKHGNGFPELMTENGTDHGIYFYGDQATIMVNRSKLIIFPEKDRENPTVVNAEGGDMEHKQDFLDCIKSRNQPTCSVEDGYHANLPCLVGLISWQVGHEVKWDWENQTIINDPEAERLMTRDYRAPWQLPKI